MFDIDANIIFFSLFFSIIGMGFFSYGRKQNAYFLLSGIGLMIFPYFVSDLVWLIVVGILLTAAPFVCSRLWPL